MSPTPRCWRQVGGSESRSWRWWQESRSPGRNRISRKAIAQGRPDASAKPVCSCAHLATSIAHGTAGAARTRSSLRPLISRVRFSCKTPGASRRENEKSYLFVARMSAATSGTTLIPPQISLRSSGRQVWSTVIARSEATQQSILPSLQYGLLRGACHRARIRATRWFAMTA